MRAVVCTATGDVGVMEIQDLPLPTPAAGQVLLKILGFGINRAEMYTRQGHSPGVVFPRIVGIECVGAVDGYGAPSDDPGPGRHHHWPPFPLGTRVAACMGGLGREIPGSYAEYTCVAARDVRPIPPPTTTKTTGGLPIGVLAALPEMLQTTWGSLFAGLDLRPGESLLVRGATSSIGLCALQLARRYGAGRVGATSRDPRREQMLRDSGADEVYIDGGEIAEDVARSAGGGFDKVLELIGTTTLIDSAKCDFNTYTEDLVPSRLVPKGTVCMTGIQGGEWELKSFMPMAALPNRVRLCAYGGSQADLLAMPWDEMIRDIEAGRIKIPIREFKLDDIHEVHRILESGGGGAKMVVVLADDESLTNFDLHTTTTPTATSGKMAHSLTFVDMMHIKKRQEQRGLPPQDLIERFLKWSTIAADYFPNVSPDALQGARKADLSPAGSEPPATPVGRSIKIEGDESDHLIPRRPPVIPVRRAVKIEEDEPNSSEPLICNGGGGNGKKRRWNGHQLIEPKKRKQDKQ
ncbi:hypothetical protein GGR56DRAFT_676554 [Xylariaceae sp. FL0804]|nr:hypothetical protein GGR56DRAFT_676554 [Xylariaceae sp. FL0804]